MYRKTIAYCMICMLILQLFTGMNVTSVEASAIAATTVIRYGISDDTVITSEQCDSESMWEIPYEIEDWTASEGEQVQLSVTQRLEGESADRILLTDGKICAVDTEGAGIERQSLTEGIDVRFDQEGEVRKGAIRIHREKDAKATYQITMEIVRTDGTEVGKKICSLRYIDVVKAPGITMQNVTEGLGSAIATTAGEGVWTKKTVAFDIEVSDTETELKTVVYDLDGEKDTVDLESRSAKTDSKYFNVTASAASKDGHKLTVTATNKLDKTTTYTRYILVDKDQPVIALAVDSEGTGIQKDKVYKSPLTVYATVTDALSKNAMSVYYRINGTEENVTADPAGSDCYPRVFDQDGAYQIEVLARDGAGNEIVSDSVSFVVDGTDPVIEQTSKLEDGRYYYGDQTFSYQVKDLNLTGGKASLTVERTLDGVTKKDKEETDFSDGKDTFSYLCDEEGYYCLKVQVTDAAGNQAQPYEIAFTIDNTQPVFTVQAVDNEGNPFANGGMTKQGVKVTLQAEDRNQLFSEYKVKTRRKDPEGNDKWDEQVIPAAQWNDTDTGRNEQNVITADTAISFLEEGYYEVSISGKDQAGNWSQSETFRFYIDRTAPVVDQIRYTTNQIPIDLKYGIIFGNQAIQVAFHVADAVVGVPKNGAVYVTIGTQTDRTQETKVYPAATLDGCTYFVTLPLEEVDYFDNRITIWAHDELDNELAVKSERTIYNTNASRIRMDCVSGNEGVWTNQNVVYDTVVSDALCGLRKVTYTKIELVNGQEQRTVIHEVDFDEKYKQGEISDFVTEYSYSFVAEDTAQTVEGYQLQIDVVNNCGTTNSMTKTVYVDKEPPVITLTGLENGRHYNYDQKVHTDVSDVSYTQTKTTYYVTRSYDDTQRPITWDEFQSTQYKDSTDRSAYLEGYYEVYAIAKDGAGNETKSNILTFAIDKHAPLIESVHVIAGVSGEEKTADADEVYYLNEDGRLEITATDHFPAKNTYIEVEGKMQGNMMQQERHSILEQMQHFITRTPYADEGKYAVEIGGKDQAGNIVDLLYRDIVIDKTSPQLSISGIQEGTLTKNAVTLTYQAVDKNHDFDQYKVTVHRTTLDGEEDTTVEQNSTDWKQSGYDRNLQKDYTTSRSMTYTTEGNYEITLEGVDKAGNVAVAQTITFSIDHTAPVISDITYADMTGLLKPRYDIIFSNKQIRVQFAVKDRVVGVENAYVYVTLGDGKDRLADAPLYIAKKGADDYYYVYVPADMALTEYDGLLTIWANDRLRNESCVQTMRMIQNTDKPAITMDCDLDYTKWQSRDVTFHTKVSDSKSGIREVTYSIDGKDVKTVVFDQFVKEYCYDLTAGKTADKVSGYTVEIQVTNNNGTESGATRQVYIDKRNPVVKLSGVENGTHYRRNQNIVTDVEDVSFKNTRTQYYVTRTLDGRTYKEKVDAYMMRKYKDQCSRQFRKEGRYQIYAITTDSAGNQTKSNTLRFVIDKTAPKIAISGTSDGSMNGTDVSLQFDLTDSFYQTVRSVIKIERTLDGNTTSSEETAFPKKGKHSTWNHTFSEDGTYTVTFTATDKAGNKAKTQKITFSVDKTQPVIQITGTTNYEQWDKPVTVRFAVEESYYAGNRIVIQGTRQDINGEVEELDLPAITNSAKVSSLLQTFKQDGIYNVTVTARDEAGNQDKQEIHFTLDQTRPEIHKVKQYQSGYYQEFRIADSLEEVFRDLTVVSYRILLNGVEYDGTTPVTEEGKYNLSVEVEDELGHKSTESAEFIIDHTAPKVIFTGVKDGESVTESGAVTLSLTNPEDEITSVSMNGITYDADTRQLEYTEYGNYRIDVDCVDKAGNQVVRSIHFTYHNPLTTMILFAIMGGLIVMTCIWLWVRSIRKEKEEKRT